MRATPLAAWHHGERRQRRWRAQAEGREAGRARDRRRDLRRAGALLAGWRAHRQRRPVGRHDPRVGEAPLRRGGVGGEARDLPCGRGDQPRPAAEHILGEERHWRSEAHARHRDARAGGGGGGAQREQYLSHRAVRCGPPPGDHHGERSDAQGLGSVRVAAARGVRMGAVRRDCQGAGLRHRRPHGAMVAACGEWPRAELGAFSNSFPGAGAHEQ
mmetsp:Transcript_49822/g.123835  ORF Transcript_49822/g.123835 Transcript_49822/m.123835 type:complete len:215 (+) Transcript_49822:233-877(+)